MIDGFVLVDKPGGWTSHDVVAKVRRLAGQRKVGHAGTLDPMATGLVVVGLGRCTRLLRFVQDQPKVYEARARFGVATDTLDADGTETSRAPLPVTLADVQAVLDGFRGEITQVPPMVSALKQGGRRLHELAREGTVVERPPRAVTIEELHVTDVTTGDYPEVAFWVRCGSGTYIRSLADDIARALGGRAHLTALRRTENGGHTVESAATIAELEADLTGAVLSPRAGLPEIQELALDDRTVAAVRNGAALPVEPGGELDVGPVRLVYGGQLVAVYRNDGTDLKAEVVLT